MKYFILFTMFLTGCSISKRVDTYCYVEKDWVCEHYGTHCIPVERTICIRNSPERFTGSRGF